LFSSALAKGSFVFLSGWHSAKAKNKCAFLCVGFFQPCAQRFRALRGCGLKNLNFQLLLNFKSMRKPEIKT